MRTTRKLLALLVLSAGIMTALLISTRPTLATGGPQQGKGKGSEGKGNDRDQPPPPYNPYPPGILPADLVQEIERVRGEVRSIETEALAQSQALPPPTLTNQPPILANTGQSRRQSGAGPSGRYARTRVAGHGLHRVPAHHGCVQTTF